MSTLRLVDKSPLKPVECFIQADDSLAPARAVIIAALFSLPFWIGIAWCLA